MRYFLPLVSFVVFVGCTTPFTINGLICPTNDQDVIQNDLQTCHVNDLDKIDAALQNGRCKKCLEQKGYKVDANASK